MVEVLYVFDLTWLSVAAVVVGDDDLGTSGEAAVSLGWDGALCGCLGSPFIAAATAAAEGHCVLAADCVGGKSTSANTWWCLYAPPTAMVNMLRRLYTT